MDKSSIALTVNTPRFSGMKHMQRMSFYTSLKFVLALPVIALFSGCEKEFDSPPKTTPGVGDVLTIAQLKSLFSQNPVHFDSAMSVYAVVNSDENDGNFYKNVYVQDATGGLCLRLLNSGGLYVGDSVRIYLPGTVLAPYNGLMQLDSVDVDRNVVKQATLVPVTPLVRTIDQITVAALDTIQSMLIQLNDVEFNLTDACNGVAWADAANQATGERYVEDCDLNTVMVRTSGYANYAGQALPTGKGSIICVASIFGSTIQLYNRSMAGVNMNGTRCVGQECPTLCDPGTSVNQDFSSTTANVNVNLPCWLNQAQVGSRFWRGYLQTGDLCTQATAYGSSNATDVGWLITPPTTFAPGMTLSFRSQRGFGVTSHDPFGLFISTNYDISNLSTANWVPVPSTYATPSIADQIWVPSGNIDLSTVLPPGYTGNFVIGFRYTGSDPNGETTNFRIDDVVIQ